MSEKNTTQKDDIIIRTHNITKVYVLGSVEKVYALRGISVEVRRGEYLSILGPSGSGKSTFFNMVGALDRPTEGHVMVDGYNLQTLNQKQLAWIRCHKMGYIFQQFNLIQTMTALENVALPRIFAGEKPEDAREQAAEILKVVGLGHRMTHLPSQVSGGQQQRIAIARALVNKPSIILADEPTGNLDLKTGEEIIALLGEMKERFGITIITATHDMKMLSASDTVVWIKDGRADRVAHKGEFNVSIGTIDGKTLA
ncbi:MAG: ABC transporter ATP-binding protein [Victivallales bacterium]|nr:ABC transporter ATP-binding protein [Victivallales bacterium]